MWLSAFRLRKSGKQGSDKILGLLLKIYLYQYQKNRVLGFFAYVNSESMSYMERMVRKNKMSFGKMEIIYKVG